MRDFMAKLNAKERSIVLEQYNEYLKQFYASDLAYMRQPLGVEAFYAKYAQFLDKANSRKATVKVFVSEGMVEEVWADSNAVSIEIYDADCLSEREKKAVMSAMRALHEDTNGKFFRI